MKHFFYRLIAPRPDFHLSMTETEAQAMQQHMIYWRELVDKKQAIIYGPVFDPKGVFGMAIVETEEDDEVENIALHDPAVSSRVCTYEMVPMQVGGVRE